MLLLVLIHLDYLNQPLSNAAICLGRYCSMNHFPLPQGPNYLFADSFIESTNDDFFGLRIVDLLFRQIRHYRIIKYKDVTAKWCLVFFFFKTNHQIHTVVRTSSVMQSANKSLKLSFEVQIKVLNIQNEPLYDIIVCKYVLGTHGALQ